MQRFQALIFLAVTGCSTSQGAAAAGDGGGTPLLPACTSQQDEAPCDLGADDGGCAGCSTDDAGYDCYCTPYSIGDASAVWSCAPTGFACQP
ncbi:MAG TPA: hypothetical protein VGL81_15755 [Polyangiaceae bacterium]|jgi:hypothetical protein